MKALAEFVMRGRVHAIGASMVCASLPILNWLSTSIVSLVVLHRGGVEGSLVLLCALLPMGVVIYLTGGAPTPVIALLGTVGLAYVLRVTMSWEITLVLAVVFRQLILSFPPSLLLHIYCCKLSTPLWMSQQLGSELERQCKANKSTTCREHIEKGI